MRGRRGWFISHQVWLLRRSFKFDVFGDESGIGQRQPAPAPQSKAPSKGGQLLVDDVVVLEFLLQLFQTSTLTTRPRPLLASKRKESIKDSVVLQGLGCLAADVGLASRNKDGQLLAFGGDVVGIRRKPEIHYSCGCGGVRRGLQKLHDIVQSGLLFSGKVCVLCLCHGVYMCFLVFNNSLDVGQKGVQLPDEPRHGVRQGI